MDSTLDLGNNQILTGFREMRYKATPINDNNRYINYGKITKELYNVLKTKKNIEFGVSDRIMPITFFAVDIFNLSDKSFIGVLHLLYEKESKEAAISYVVKPENEKLFNILKEQIEIIWKYAKKTKNEKTYLDE